MMGQELISLGILFLFAVIGGAIANRFKQPAAIGLLIVGAVIGPNALNLVKNTDMINLMVEFGAILLLFVIGLEFVIPKLVRLGFKAMMIGFLKIGIVFFLTYEGSLLIGLSPLTAAIYGVLLSLSSTVVIVKILQSKGLYHERHEVPLLIGVLLIEDIFAVLVLTFLSGAKNNMGILATVEHMVIAITILSIAYFVFLRLSKFIVSMFLKHSDDEAITFIALGICVGFSYLAYYLGLSPSIGAFLAGSIVASLPDVRLFEHAIKPYSLTFSSLFFISIGTMVNFSSIKEHVLLIFFFIAIIIISRFIAVGTISQLFANFSKEQMIFSSLAMISVSEFSLLIAQSVMKLKIGIDVVSITAFIIFVTALIMSFSINYYSKVSNLLDKAPKRNWSEKPRSLSKYIKLFFEEIDIENYDTSQFKKFFFRFLMGLGLLLFSLIGWRRLFVLFTSQQFPLWSQWILHILAGAIIAFICYKIYIIAKNLYDATIVILANIDYARSEKKSRYVLNNILITFLFFIVIIISPVILVLAKTPYWMNIFPFILMLVTFIKLKKVFNVVHHIQSSQPEQYKISGLSVK